MRRNVIFSVILNLFILASAQFVWAQEEGSQKFHGFNLQGYTDGGDKAWDVNGTTANIKGESIEIIDVDANQYGKEDMNLKAKTGVIDKATGDIHLEKNVVITTKTRGKLTTDTLDWKKQEDIVTTQDKVFITDKGMTASGLGLEARPGLKTAKLKRAVTVNVETEPEKKNGSPVTITCDGPMEIDQNANMAVFQDNVVAVQDDKTLKADRMEVHFDPDTSQIEQTICIGNVEIVQGENVTYSQRAVYNASDKKLILSGRPKLIMVTEGDGGISPLK